MCLCDTSKPSHLNGPALFWKTSAFLVNGWRSGTIRLLANRDHRITPISLIAFCTLLALAGCADFPKQLETFLTADDLVKDSA